MKYVVISIACFVGAAIGLYVWALTQPNIFENLDEAYN